MLPDGDVIEMTEPAELLGIEIDGLNGRWAASPSGQVAIPADSTIEIWDPTSGEFVRKVDKPVLCAFGVGWDIAFAGTADDGTVVVRCSGFLMAWDLASPGRASQWQVTIANQNYNARIRISPDQSRILVPADKLKLIDAETGDTVAEVAAGSVINDAYSPDGRLILAVDWPGDVHVFDADDLTLIKRLKPSGGAVNDGEGSPVLAVSPDNEYVAAWHTAMVSRCGTSSRANRWRRSMGAVTTGPTSPAIARPPSSTGRTRSTSRWRPCASTRTGPHST